MKLTKELTAAMTLAAEAAGIIMSYYHRDTIEGITLKHGVEPVTDADRGSNEHIVTGINRLFPGDAILAEESANSPARLDNSRVWIIDPLDGTKEFIARNGEFAVMIGLAVNHRPMMGVVVLPAKNKTFYASSGQGAFLREGGREVRLRCSPNSDPTASKLVMSRSHLSALERTLIDFLNPSEQLISGSVGVKIGLISEGFADIYLTASTRGIKEWDTCAPELILREAGGAVCDLDGKNLDYNKENVVQQRGIVATCSQAMQARVLATIKPHLV